MDSSVFNPHQVLPVPMYENISALTNRLGPAAQREPIDEQDGLHCASINFSLSENEVDER